MSDSLFQELETLANQTAKENGFDLCCLQLLTHLIPMTMQVQIRHLGGEDVSLDDCARFSAPMEEAIETSNLLNQAYVLEISSPGISAQLEKDRDFRTFKGFPVEVTFKDDKNFKHRKTGLLHERSSDHLQINIKGQIKRIPRQNILEVRLTTPTG